MTLTPTQLFNFLANYRLDPGLPLGATQLEPMRDSMIEASRLSRADLIPFFEQSAALYLRRVLEVYKSLDVSGGYETAAALYQAHWLRHSLETAAGARFAREHPLENRQLSNLVLDQISHLPDRVFSDDSATSDLLPFIDLLIYTTSNRRLTGPQPPIKLSQSTVEGLQRRVPFIQHLIEDQPFPLSPDMIWSLSGLSGIIENGRESRVIDPEDMSDEDVVVWSSCELLRDGEDRDLEKGMVRCDKGVEMMACGRCLAVRYCCREHQRAHWKRHKLFCFKPEW